MNNKISQHYRKTSAEVCMFSIFILFFLLCSGCSKNITAVTSTDDPELRCEKIPSSLSNSEEFWEYAYENIPTVSIDDVESGNYNNTYICIDGIILRNYAEILVAFQKNDGTYCDDSFLPLKTSCKYGYGFITEASSGTSVKICVYVEKS